MGGLLFPPLDNRALVVYSEVMERHAANIENKATRALELIEEILIPAVGFDTNRDGLIWYRGQLFGTDHKLAEALWHGIGAAEAYFADRGTMTTFNESRPVIADKLDARILETRPVVAVDDDPFAGLGFEAGGNMSAAN